MNKSWKSIKFGLVLLALPLVATAAASAHLQMVQSSPIMVSTEVSAPSATTVGLDRAHTVALNRDGGVDGRIVGFESDSKIKGLSELDVRFVRDGKTVSRATTDADGVFAAQNLPEGTYSFIASGDNGFAAYSVRVLSDSSGKYDDVMEAVAVSQVTSVKQIIDAPSAVPAILSDVDKELMDEKGANRVVLKNGALNGRVLLTTTDEIQTTEVHILRNGIPVAKVMTDENGAFQVPDMNPGVYAFIAIGPQGMAVVGFEAVAFETQVSKLVEDVAYVSTAGQDLSVGGQEVPVYADALNVYMVGTDYQPEPVQEPVMYDDGGLLPIEYAGQDFAYGACGGSCGGACGAVASPCSTCGGGGAGGVRGGRLLAIGALAAAIVALSTDGGSNPPPASPVSP